MGRAREAGLAVVLATQDPSDLEAVDHALLPQVLQDTAWQIVFRQGSPQDAERMQALFGKAWMVDESWSNDGRVTKREVERLRVSIDEWMNALEPGDAWLRVAPVDGRWRQERVRVALPSVGKQDSETASETKARARRVLFPSGSVGGASAGALALPRATQNSALPPVPPDCPEKLVEKMGADILAKVDRRWPRKHHELGPCLVWREGEPTIKAAAGAVYGRPYDSALGRSDAAHRVVWRRVYGPIPAGMTVDHVCEITLCQRPDHLELVTRAENTRRRHQGA